MSFTDRIASVAQRASQMADRLETEEATKNALVMPFIQALGYDIFNPDEVVPEFTADVGTKKGEKVDYAILRDDKVIMLFECKKAGVDLTDVQMSQLYRYFSVTEARIGILTDGIKYRFYSDLEEPNKMDQKPFLIADVRRMREAVVNELRKLTRDGFDLDQMLDAASDLKNLSQIRAHLSKQYEEPDEEFVKLFFSATNPGRHFRSSVRGPFGELVKQAFHNFVNDKVSDRLRSALEREQTKKTEEEEESIEPEGVSEDGIVTTPEELEGFHIVKSIARTVVDAQRITYRDTKSYFSVLLDDNNRKPICRLRFNSSQKYVGVFDAAKSESRVPIESLDDIYKLTEQICSTASRYDGNQTESAADSSPDTSETT